MHPTTLRKLILVVVLIVLAGALWYSRGDEAPGVAGAAADSASPAAPTALTEAQRQARLPRWSAQRRQLEEQQIATLSEPFRRLLLSMNRRELQLGPDGKRYPIDSMTGVTTADGMYLYNLARQVKPRKTLEIGLAEGFSMLYMLAALEENGQGTHVAVDPFETSYWHGLALQKVREAGMSRRFRYMEDYSIFALPALKQKRESFDIVFVDGDHKFDSAFIDFALSDAVCANNCYILLHDIWMPSIAKVAQFIEFNRPDYARRPVPEGVNIVAFQKVGPDKRTWTDFVNF